MGNQTLAANGAGTYTLTYDAVDRVTNVLQPFGLSLTFAYDAVGNRTGVDDSKGGLATSVYDAANRLTSRQFTGNSATVRFDYAYTDRDQVASIARFSDLAGTTQVGLISIAYDAAGRTEVVKHRDGASNWFQTTTYSYDLADRMTVETRNGTPVTYTYDATDQLTGDGSNDCSDD